MAISPVAKYPSQVTAASGAYPYGSAKNKTSIGDSTATPLEQDWVNDLWGFLQSLLSAGGVTPSGNPDQVGASDYLTAMRAAMRVVISPSSISAAQDDYSPTGWSEATIVRLTCIGDETINGLDSTAKVKSKLLVNVDLTSTDDITLAHLATGQSTGNRVSSPTGAALKISPGDAVMVVHDAASGLWRAVLPPLGADYSWAGAHAWGSGLVISAGGSTLTGTGSVDLSGSVESARFLIDHSSNEFDYKSARVRSIFVSPHDFQLSGAQSIAGAVQFTGTTDVARCSLQKFLPTGATILGLQARINQNSGVSSAGMRMILSRAALDFGSAGGFVDTVTTLYDVEEGSAGSGDFLLADGEGGTTTHTNALPSTAVNMNSDALTITVTPSDAVSGGNPETFMGLRLSFTDPGPRNY